MVIIREEFFILADKNICAASLLDRFNARVATNLEFSWIERRQKNYQKQTPYQVDYTLEYLFRQQCEVFTEEEIINGINLLINKRYLSLNKQDNGIYFFTVHKQQIQDDVAIFLGNSVQPEEVGEEVSTHEAPDTSECSDTKECIEPPITNSTPPSNRSETRRVDYHNNRAIRVGLPGTLTTKQWLKTLDHFDKRCAFCLDGKYEVLEHFIPIIHGGGTTDYNCVPSCAQCNRIKHDLHPTMISGDSPLVQMIPTIQQYLESRRVCNVEEVER